jgi:hypothetical protein
MKRFVPAALVLTFLIGLSGWSSPAGDTWKQVSSFQYDWDHHGAATFIFELPSAGADGGGDFTRLRIQVPGRKEFVLVNEDGWVDYPSDGASISSKLPKTVTSSKHVLAVRAMEKRTLLFLFGYGYASSFGKFDVVEISEAGDPQVVLHRDEFMLEELRDLDGDGIPEVVGKTCLSQTWGNDLLTYDPFNVYKLDATAGSPAKLSLALSKSYNLKHYYGWAGVKCSEDFAVVLHPPGGGKPVVVSKQKAEKMTASKQ